MQIRSSECFVENETSSIRVSLNIPIVSGHYPAIVVFSDIFQLTPSTLRVCARLAGYGFVVAAPEIFGRRLPAGTALPFDDDGRIQGLEAARSISVDEFDADTRSVLRFLKACPDVNPRSIGALGFCFGGHLAFRAAMEPGVKAAACCYPTGIHDAVLGSSKDVDSLRNLVSIKGKMLMVFGDRDPHVSSADRSVIASALTAAGIPFSLKLYAGEHAFMRDVGPRYDPEAADSAFGEIVGLFRENLV